MIRRKLSDVWVSGQVAMRVLSSCFLVGMAAFCSIGRAAEIASFDLDALNESNFYELELNAGQYTISLRNGAFTAWSAWSETANDGCTNDCLQGWLNFFAVYNIQSGQGVYVENGLGIPLADYDFNARLAYSTPEAALAAAPPYHFNLDSAATVQIAIPDCAGCYIDNRGGLSFTLTVVPEPTTLNLTGVGLALLGRSRRQRGTKRTGARAVTN